MHRFEFFGSGWDYFKIWIVNILLTIITVGIYYPWAKVRTKRYFYGNTNLEGDSFDYHATGRQLFLGYVVGMILLLIYVGIQKLFPVGGVIVLFLFIIALPWLVYKSLRFNMAVTSFNNVRFAFKNKLSRAYLIFLVYPISLFLGFALLIGLGISVGSALSLSMNSSLSMLKFPIEAIFVFGMIVCFLFIMAYMRTLGITYMITGSRYGDGIFYTNLNYRVFMSIFMKLLLMMVIWIFVVGAITGLVIVIMSEFSSLMMIFKQPQTLELFLPILAPLFMIAYVLLVLAIFSYLFTAQRQYVFENTTLDNSIKFVSVLKAMPLFFVLFSNIIATVVTLGLAYPWTKVRLAKYIANHTVMYFDERLRRVYKSEALKRDLAFGEEIGDAFDVDVGMGLGL